MEDSPQRSVEELRNEVESLKAADYPWLEMKLFFSREGLWSGHWTSDFDGVKIEIVEDRPRKDAGSWGEEIWAVVKATATPAERARIRDQWHTRLDVPIWTVRYRPVVLLTLGISAAGFVLRYFELRRRKRSASGLCPACGYDLRASTDHCPEYGTQIPAKAPTIPAA